MDMALHVVALSGGKDSTCLALALKEAHPDIDFTCVCTPTGDELPDMLAHWARLDGMLRKPIIRIEMPGGLKEAIRQENMLPNFRARFCTRVLKIEPYRLWLTQQAAMREVVSYVGLRYDEPGRAGGYYDDIDGVTTRYPFREWKWNVQMIWDFLDKRGITIPLRTDCARCYHQQLGEWYALWREHRDIFNDAIADEDRYGHTYRSPGRDTWPIGLRELGRAFEIKAPERSLKMAAKRMENRAQCRVCSL